MHPFAKKSSFDAWIISPLKTDRPDSTQNLGNLVRATCLRRTKRQLGSSIKLPSRTERVEIVELDPVDKELYLFFKHRTAEIAAGLPEAGGGTTGANRDRGRNIIPLINFLRLICDHGERLLPFSALQAWRNRQNESIDWDMMRGSIKSCSSCGLTLEQSDRSEAPDLCLLCTSSSASPAAPSVASTQARICDLQGIRPSAKVQVLINNLRQEQKVGDADGNSKQEKR